MSEKIVEKVVEKAGTKYSVDTSKSLLKLKESMVESTKNGKDKIKSEMAEKLKHIAECSSLKGFELNPSANMDIKSIKDALVKRFSADSNDQGFSDLIAFMGAKDAISVPQMEELFADIYSTEMMNDINRMKDFASKHGFSNKIKYGIKGLDGDNFSAFSDNANLDKKMGEVAITNAIDTDKKDNLKEGEKKVDAILDEDMKVKELEKTKAAGILKMLHIDLKDVVNGKSLIGSIVCLFMGAGSFMGDGLKTVMNTIPGVKDVVEKVQEKLAKKKYTKDVISKIGNLDMNDFKNGLSFDGKKKSFKLENDKGKLGEDFKLANDVKVTIPAGARIILPKNRDSNVKTYLQTVNSKKGRAMKTGHVSGGTNGKTFIVSGGFSADTVFVGKGITFDKIEKV